MGLAALRAHLTAARPVRQSDGRGGFTTTWQPLGPVHGRVGARLDAPSVALQAALGGRPAYVLVVDGRTAPALQVGDRLSDAARSYELVQVQAQGRYLVCWGAPL